jgi:hypothetical protein
MVNASIKVGWTSPVVNTSRSFYIDRETRFPYIQQISHSETDAQVTESPLGLVILVLLPSSRAIRIFESFGAGFGPFFAGSTVARISKET